jgi:hypothetical protein
LGFWVQLLHSFPNEQSAPRINLLALLAGLSSLRAEKVPQMRVPRLAKRRMFQVPSQPPFLYNTSTYPLTDAPMNLHSQSWDLITILTRTNHVLSGNANQLDGASSRGGLDATSLGVCVPCGSCWGGTLTGSAGLTGGVNICCRGEGDSAGTGGNTAEGGWAPPTRGVAAGLATPLMCCWGLGAGGEFFVGDKPPLGGGSGEEPDAA